jgi:hypothetical protein
MFTRLVKYMVLPAALFLYVSIGAFAHSRNEHSLDIPNAVQVGSVHLKAGTYRIEWQGDASSLNVEFLQHGKIVATTQGKMVERKEPAPTTAIVTAEVNNTQMLKEIEFGGKKDALIFSWNLKAEK